MGPMNNDLMLSKLCNVSSTFTTPLNNIFWSKTNKIVVIYIDDILAHSKTSEECANTWSGFLKS